MQKKKYVVNKFYKRFRQCWLVDATSYDEAWNRAERYGALLFQNIYSKYQDVDSNGYIICLEDDFKMKPPITDDYWLCLQEAMECGMIATPGEYEKVYGLPFHDVWRD